MIFFFTQILRVSFNNLCSVLLVKQDMTDSFNNLLGNI